MLYSLYGTVCWVQNSHNRLSNIKSTFWSYQVYLNKSSTRHPPMNIYQNWIQNMIWLEDLVSKEKYQLHAIPWASLQAYDERFPSFFLLQPFLFPLTFSSYLLEMGNDDITRLFSYCAEIIIKCLIYITRGVRFLESANNADTCMLLKAIQ